MMRDALDMLTKRLSKVIANLKSFALQWKGTETLLLLLPYSYVRY